MIVISVNDFQEPRVFKWQPLHYYKEVIRTFYYKEAKRTFYYKEAIRTFSTFYISRVIFEQERINCFCVCIHSWMFL